MEFEEKQNLNLWWLYILLGVDAIIVLSILLFDNGGMSYQNLQKVYFAPVIAVLLPFFIIFLIQKNILTTSMNDEGILYQYFPFQIKPRLFQWNNMEKVYINSYDALGNYGGWGVR
ncbi:hypothetical protein [Pedobacter mendelii]|uniref:PH domain-containing protein n=1 Tax=Pedobacter mendelii TaxID=1908240 RepID=A0ABQ2BJA1_9SPHI|nr:hypothetical protein [Pedobacter mendelii]GGI25612.1 hypothetical protein GCM10008119_18530 [Pedobacter mendelii]